MAWVCFRRSFSVQKSREGPLLQKKKKKQKKSLYSNSSWAHVYGVSKCQPEFVRAIFSTWKSHDLVYLANQLRPSLTAGHHTEPRRLDLETSTFQPTVTNSSITLSKLQKHDESRALGPYRPKKWTVCYPEYGQRDFTNTNRTSESSDARPSSWIH
jgi:hypothetical protein